MFAWLNPTTSKTPDVSGRLNSIGTAEARISKAPEADFDACLRRAVQGTVMATLALHRKSNLPLPKCARLIQMMQETSSNEVLHQSSGLHELALGTQAVNTLNAFVVQLHFAERLTEAVSHTGSAEEPDTSHRPLLNDAWISAAATAKRLVDILTCDATMDDTRRGFFEMIGTSLGLIQAHLDHVADSRPSQLPLVDRRTHKRTLLGVWVRMATSSMVGDAFLSDISATGFGIATPLAITSGAAIEIEVPDGRILGARVAWVRGTRAGARFLTPLDPQDNLISAATTNMRLRNLTPAEPLEANQSGQRTKLTVCD